MPTITTTPYPKWVPHHSRVPNRPGVFAEDDPGWNEAARRYVAKDPNDEEGALGEPFIVPMSDYDWAIDPAGNIVPVVMSTNRVDSRYQCDSNHADLQRRYKTGKGWKFYERTAPGSKVVQTVEQWVEANAGLIEKRRAKSLKSQKNAHDAWRPRDELLAKTITDALRQEAEAIAKATASATQAPKDKK